MKKDVEEEGDEDSTALDVLEDLLRISGRGQGAGLTEETRPDDQGQ